MQPAPPTLAVANPRLLGLMRETVLPPLLDAFADVVDGLREPLLEQGARLAIDLAPLIDGLYVMRQQRDGVLAAYRTHLVRAWQALESGAPMTSRLSFDHRSSSLDLVEHDELEVQLAIHHLADALTREWQSQLLSLNSYLTWIDPGLRMDADSNPFSPAQIAMAVYEGFSAVALPGVMRINAVACCERDLIELVGPIYETVYSILTREFGVPDAGSSQGRIAHFPSAGTEASEPEPDWLTRFFVGWEGAAPEQAKAGSAASAASVVSPTGTAQGSAAADNTNAGSTPADSMPADSTLPAALHRLLEDSRAAREQVQERDPAMHAPRDTLSQRELVSILTLLQIAPDEAIAAMVRPPGALLPRLKKQMFQTAALLGVEARAVRLSAADENIVDLIGMLFQQMFDECDLSPAQREVLGKLIAPLTKVALQDRQLFLQATHPARRLLNVLAEACEGNHGESGEERELLEKVEATVTRLAMDFDESQSVFRALRGDFALFYGEYRRRAEIAEREVAERQRLEEALEKARNWARASLLSRLQGRLVPAPVRELLRARWVGHAAALEAGGKGHVALMQVDGLLQALESVQKEGSAARWDSVADWLQPVWMSSGKSRPEIVAARSAMIEALGHDAIAPAGPLAEARGAAAAMLPEPDAEVHSPRVDAVGPVAADALQAGVDFDNVTADYFTHLPVGTWLDFVGRDNRVQAGKLSWVSPISSRLLFVTRSGSRIAVASPQELAIMVKLDRLRVHRPEDAFYSAMQGVIDRLGPLATDRQAAA